MAHVTFTKPLKGTALLVRRDKRAVRVHSEQSVMRAAKQLDGHKCRVPLCEFAKRDMPIDACHVIHRGSGGNPKGDRTTLESVFAACRIHHGMYDRGELPVKFLDTKLGTRGPMAFLRFVAGVQVLIGISEPRR